MGIDENYHDDLKRLATHPDLLPQETQECGISDENKELLHKAGAIHTLMTAKKQGLSTSTQNMRAAGAGLIFMKSRRNLSESTMPSSILCGDCILYKHKVSRSRRIFLCKTKNRPF